MRDPGETLLLGIFGFSVLAVCISLSLLLLNWRVENEPGAAGAPGLRLAGILLLAVGLSGTVVCLRVLRTRHGIARRGILVTACVALVIYLPLLALTLAMLV